MWFICLFTNLFKPCAHAAGWHVTGFLKWLLFATSACVHLYLPPSLLTSGLMWQDMNWLNQFYSFQMAAIVSNDIVGMVLELKHIIKTKANN